MPSSLKKLCIALALASSAVTTLASDSRNQDLAYVRSLKHARHASSHHNDAGPSTLDKRSPTYSGRATYYAAGLGACGNYNSGSDFIVALNAAQYGNLGQRSSWCGKTITITYNGNTQYATVQDACPSCPYGGLDMSEGLFKAFASTDLGVFYMTWTAADGSGGDNNDQPRTTSTKPAWTPKPNPTSTWTPPPSSTWTPAPTSTQARSSSTSSSASSSSASQSSSTSASSSSSANSASPISSSSSTTDSQAANNLDSFALIYQGLNQMAVAAVS